MPEAVPHAMVRLLSLVSWIGEYSGATVDEVAAHFGRTRRQITRDIEYLGSVGDSLPGASFEIDWDLYETQDRLSLRTTMGAELPPRLTPQEATAILIGLEAIAPTLDDNLRSRLPRTAMAVRALAADQHLQAPVIRVASHDTPNITQLRDAINSDCAVTFSYTDTAGRASHRHVDPWSLHQTGSGWLLRGWCHTATAERRFRLDQITDLHVETDRRTRQLASPTPAPASTITLRLDNAARWILDDYQLTPTAQTTADFTVDLPVWDDEWVDALLIDLSAHILDAPQDVRERAARRARAALTTWESHQ